MKNSSIIIKALVASLLLLPGFERAAWANDSIFIHAENAEFDCLASNGTRITTTGAEPGAAIAKLGWLPKEFGYFLTTTLLGPTVIALGKKGDSAMDQYQISLAGPAPAGQRVTLLGTIARFYRISDGFAAIPLGWRPVGSISCSIYWDKAVN